MRSQLTIDDLPAHTRDLREHLPSDLDTTADLPNENTADLTTAAAGTPRMPGPSPLDDESFAPMPRLRALGFFAFAACAFAAIFVTTVPRSELSEPQATPPTQLAQSKIGAETRAVELAAITPVPEAKQIPVAAAAPEVAGGGAPASLITFASRSLVTSEKAMSAVFIIKRTKAATGNATVHWSARSGSADAGIDFSDASGTVRFADGQRQRAIYVPLRNDLLKEGDETFKVCLRSPQRARIAGGSCAETTIRDDDSDNVAST